MGAEYTRQSAAEIVDGEVAEAVDVATTSFLPLSGAHRDRFVALPWWRAQPFYGLGF